MAMYTAKQSGRDRIAVFTPSEAELARTDARKSWSHQIRNALENNGLVLYRQPIVDLGTGRPSHSELLLRMRQGDRLIEPGAFLESAERLGLIHAIDHWVVTSAVELVMRTPPQRRRPVSINLSGESVAGDPELLALIRSELDVAGVNPGLLIFEVTETAAISNIAEAQAFAEGVRALGCRIALDDFGTGFGSFYHLKHLPADYVKIDHEFVHELVGNGLDQRIVSSIVEVATELGIETVAEAVGDEDTVRLLRDLGVDYGQGFFLGRPEPIVGFD
jgi:EAL domain-containing protein (putative c-di-GMP-specific phosphodiesterase class I)